MLLLQCTVAAVHFGQLKIFEDAINLISAGLEQNIFFLTYWFNFDITSVLEYWLLVYIPSSDTSNWNTHPRDLSDTAGWAVPCLLSCAGDKNKHMITCLNSAHLHVCEQKKKKLTSFSKLTRLSWNVLLPSWMNVISATDAHFVYNHQKAFQESISSCRVLKQQNCEETFQEQRKKGNLWSLHLLEGVPVGLVVQWGILWRNVLNECDPPEMDMCLCMHAALEVKYRRTRAQRSDNPLMFSHIHLD